MRLSWIVLLTLAAFALGLVAFLPASLFAAHVNRAIAPATVALEGTVWHGTGRLAAGATTLPVAWRAAPGEWLALRAGWHLAVEGRGTATVSAGVSSVRVRDADLTLDASLLTHWLPLLSVAGPTGTLRLATARLDIGHGGTPIDGTATLTLDPLATRAWGPAGTHEFRLAGRGQAIDIAVARSGGALALAGSGVVTLTAPRELRWTGSARATDSASPALREALQRAGRPGPDGGIVLDLRMPW